LCSMICLRGARLQPDAATRPPKEYHKLHPTTRISHHPTHVCAQSLKGFKKPEPVVRKVEATGDRPVFTIDADAKRHASDGAQKLKGAKGGTKGNKGRYA